jgi:hypothetical protein
VYKKYTPVDNLTSVVSKPQKKRMDTPLPLAPVSVATGESMVRSCDVNSIYANLL